MAALFGCGPQPQRPPLQTGMPVPAEWRSPGSPQAQSGTTVYWVFRTADCLTCQNLDQEIRALHRRHGTELGTIAIHVGEPDRESIPRAYLRTRRVPASVVTIRPRPDAALPPDSLLPGVYVARGGIVTWSAPLRREPRTLSTRLDSAVNAAVRTSSHVVAGSRVRVPPRQAALTKEST